MSDKQVDEINLKDLSKKLHSLAVIKTLLKP